MKGEGRIFMDLGRDRSAACIPSTRPLSTSDRNGLRVIGWGTGWEAYTRDQNSGRCQSVTMQSLNKLPHLSKTIFYTATMPARTAVMGEGFSAIEKKKMYRPERYSLVNGA